MSRLKAAVKEIGSHNLGGTNHEFKPKNPNKYIGSIKKILAKSKLEVKVFTFCDLEKNIVGWSSEEIEIKYYDPIKKKSRSYFPDVFIRVRNPKTDKVSSILVEIKPKKFLEYNPQEYGNSLSNFKSKRFHLIQYITNMAKKKAAQEFCRKRGWTYQFWTEDVINNRIII